MRVFSVVAVAASSALTGCGGTVAPTQPMESTSTTASTHAIAASGSSSATASSATTAATYPGVTCEISAATYDQSCTADSDCALVSGGDYCSPGCFCGGSAINVSALARFNADVAKTPIGSGALGTYGCNCPAEVAPCCRSGTCSVSCSSPSDTLPECADAGGICMGPSFGCAQMGPPTSCAYADESCCIVLQLPK